MEATSKRLIREYSQIDETIREEYDSHHEEDSVEEFEVLEGLQNNFVAAAAAVVVVEIVMMVVMVVAVKKDLLMLFALLWDVLETI